MSLLGLVRHMTDVERYWFRDVTGGEDVTSLYWGQPDRDSDFDDIRAADAERDFVAYLEEMEHCRADPGRHRPGRGRGRPRRTETATPSGG